MPKILFVGNTSWSMYNFRKEVLKNFVESGYKVHVLAPNDEHSNALRKLGVKLHTLRLDKNSKNPFELFSLTWKFYRIYKDINPDLIIHYTIKPNIFGSIAAGLLKIKHWSFVTGLGLPLSDNSFISKVLKKLYRFSHQKTEKIFFLNTEDKNFFISNKLINKEQAYYLPGEGINLQEFERSSKYPEKVSFLFIGRLLVEKGVKIFAEAARKIKSTHPEIEFHVVGMRDENNPHSIEYETLQSLIEENIIDYKGFKEDVRTYLEKTACLVFPSYYSEGMPRVLLEASAMEVPLITTDNVGCRDVVVDGETGFLVKKKSVNDLFETLKQFIHMSYEGRQKMGKKGREYVSANYSMDKVVDIYVKEVEKSIGN